MRRRAVVHRDCGVIEDREDGNSHVFPNDDGKSVSVCKGNDPTSMNNAIFWTEIKKAGNE